MILEGVLATVPGSPCLQIKPLGESAIGLFWPQGYTASGNPLHVYSPQGADLAAEGDLVTLGGGRISEPSAYCRTQSYFEVSEITKGAGQYAP